MAYLFLWSVKRRSTILKCCNRSHHDTAILAVVAEAATTKVHAPAYTEIQRGDCNGNRGGRSGGFSSNRVIMYGSDVLRGFAPIPRPFPEGNRAKNFTASRISMRLELFSEIIG